MQSPCTEQLRRRANGGNIRQGEAMGKTRLRASLCLLFAARSSNLERVIRHA